MFIFKEKRDEMSFFRRTVIMLAVFVFILSAGCSKKDSSSSAKDESSVTESSSADSSDGSKDSSEAEPVPTEQGDKIKAAAKFFDNEKYEFVCKVSGIGADAVITIVKDTGVYSQVTDYGFAKSYIYCKGSETFRYDDVTKCFAHDLSSVTNAPKGNIISETVKKNLPQTGSHINKELAEKYDVEEYTYTGGTYITVLDFYFDKNKGALSRYTVNYTVEGKDDETEVRDVIKMDTTDVRKTEFSENKLREDYTDFNAMSETERDSFCRKMLEKAGAKEEDLLSAGLTMFELKKISYADFSAFMIDFTAKKK